MTNNIAPMPTADDYAAAGRRRMIKSCVWGALLSIALALIYVFAFRRITVVIPLAILGAIIVPIVLWRYPKFCAYTILASVCLFETLPLNWPDSLTDKVPFFWNLNTVLQRYAHSGTHGLPLSPFEIFLVLGTAFSLFRSVYSSSADPRIGRLFWPILAYMTFVAWGWIYGVGTGGDFKISLQEVRSQFYFLLAYLLAVNLVRDQRDLTRIQWMIVATIGIKGILYTIRRFRFITFGGMMMPDQGVGSHEEAFFFDCFVVLLLVCLMCNVYPRMRRFMWVMLPFVVMGDLSTHRRAATAALIVVIPILLLAAYRALPNRRRMVLGITMTILIGFSIYYPMFKDSYGMLAQPARAIRSQFDPDPRDKSSNDYRIAEEGDLYATIKSSPVIGYGYGKRMLHAVPIADISRDYPWWDIMTHNQILWVWMRVGTIGFLVFWLMIAAIVIFSTQILRSDTLSEEAKSAALFTLLVVSALLIFGLLDLQLSNFRDMLFAGFWVGTLAALPRMTGNQARTSANDQAETALVPERPSVRGISEPVGAGAAAWRGRS
jgi:hypothetical protein